MAPPTAPGPFDPPAPPAADTREDLFDRVRRNRIRLERGAAEVDLILDRVLPRARQLDVLLNRIDDTTRRLDDAHRRFTDFERTHTRHRQGQFQTITNLSNCAERAQRRIQAIMHALKTRDKETRAIEARLRQTMIDLTGDPDGQPAAADARPPRTPRRRTSPHPRRDGDPLNSRSTNPTGEPHPYPMKLPTLPA